jgi:hypothetical protein
MSREHMTVTLLKETSALVLRLYVYIQAYMYIYRSGEHVIVALLEETSALVLRLYIYIYIYKCYIYNVYMMLSRQGPRAPLEGDRCMCSHRVGCSS